MPPKQQNGTAIEFLKGFGDVFPPAKPGDIFRETAHFRFGSEQLGRFSEGKKPTHKAHQTFR